MSDARAPEDLSETRSAGSAPNGAFERALDRLEQAPAFAKARYQTDVFRLAAEELDSDAGVRRLRSHAARFDKAGVFHAGPWEHTSRLIPSLVRSGLLGEGQYPTLEALSELRLLSIAKGEGETPAVSEDPGDEPSAVEDEPLDATAARNFLRTVMTHNLDLLFETPSTEDSRVRPKIYARAHRILDAVRQEISIDGLLADVLDEIEQRCAQRPIQVRAIRSLLAQAAKIPSSSEDDPKTRARLDELLSAAEGATELVRASAGLSGYREALRHAAEETLQAEADRHGEVMRATGLASESHAVLVRRLRDAKLLSSALRLTDVGRACLSEHYELTRKLVSCAIHPATCNSIYGLAGVLDRALLGRTEIAGTLSKLAGLDLTSDVRAVLIDSLPPSSGVTPNGALVAGAIAVLGQPLGVGQGHNPTCQAARALSLWSQHAPGYLLEVLVSASRDGTVEMKFEGQLLSSRDLDGGVARGALDPDLDVVSRILVPHLDRLYDEMMQRAALRSDDAHKWVNPALYGRWVQNGFASVFTQLGNAVEHYADFVRLFYATHHPSYAEHAELLYPNPVGILVTDVHGKLLGYHAVSIQRIASDANGDLRVYFFNPNNEGRQRWGRGVTPTVMGHDEIAGESSLPFAQFVTHVYAFHYNPYEVGDGYAVPSSTVESIVRHAHETWGRDFAWS